MEGDRGGGAAREAGLGGGDGRGVRARGAGDVGEVGRQAGAVEDLQQQLGEVQPGQHVTRLWRTNTRAVYGPLEHMSRHTVRLDKIRAHWGDMLRVAGSLTMGTVRAYDLIRMLSADGRTTGLGEAFAHYGRISKTLHLLQFIADEGYRRMIGTQLNVQEARHRLARKIAFGNRGQLRQRYREGLEDQLGSLGLALNAVIWWNSLYLDAAVKQLRADGFPVTDEMCARLSPIQYDHINFLGRYAFSRADVAGGLRPFHDGAHEST
nr:Tn3 family transposase [Nonomuraea turkmeniaca]